MALFKQVCKFAVCITSNLSTAHNIHCYTIRVIRGFSIADLTITYHTPNLFFYKRIIVRLVRLLGLLAYTYFSITLDFYGIIFCLVLVKYLKIIKNMIILLILPDKYKHSYKSPIQPNLTSFSWDLKISSLRF